MERRSRIKVLWDDARFEGTVASQRRENGAFITRVLYDAIGSWHSHAMWHNLDVEGWDYI